MRHKDYLVCLISSFTSKYCVYEILREPCISSKVHGVSHKISESVSCATLEPTIRIMNATMTRVVQRLLYSVQ